MEGILKASLRHFTSDEHIQNVLSGEWADLFDEANNRLEGIRGRIGAAALTTDGIEIGADLIEMQPGSAFPLHKHPGDHILYVISGRGIVHIDGADYSITTGDTIFIPAEYPHGVKTYQDATTSFQFLAVGYPHKHLSSKDRMSLI
jgi:quercetin dioxygenase-like cupin family protein